MRRSLEVLLLRPPSSYVSMEGLAAARSENETTSVGGVLEVSFSREERGQCRTPREYYQEALNALDLPFTINYPTIS